MVKYIAGGSLQQRLDREGPLDVCEVLRIGIHTAKRLAAAHAQGLIHRDVKPSNILLDEGVERALLTDFGLARAGDDASLTRSGFHPGTPHYMSPEQVRGESIDAPAICSDSAAYFMPCVPAIHAYENDERESGRRMVRREDLANALNGDTDGCRKAALWRQQAPTAVRLCRNRMDAPRPRVGSRI